MPSYVKDIPYIPVCEMDLSSAKKQHSTLGNHGCVTPAIGERANVQNVQANFFESISNCAVTPAVLSIISPYNAAFAPEKNNNTKTINRAVQ